MRAMLISTETKTGWFMGEIEKKMVQEVKYFGQGPTSFHRADLGADAIPRQSPGRCVHVSWLS